MTPPVAPGSPFNTIPIGIGEAARALPAGAAPADDGIISDSGHFPIASPNPCRSVQAGTGFEPGQVHFPKHPSDGLTPAETGLSGKRAATLGNLRAIAPDAAPDAAHARLLGRGGPARPSDRAGMRGREIETDRPLTVMCGIAMDVWGREERGRRVEF